MIQLKLTASELVYGWGKCRRCAWLSARGLIAKPKPVYDFRVANALDKFAKNLATPELLQLCGHNCTSVCIPERMSSEPISFTDIGVEVLLSGQPDILSVDHHSMVNIIDIKSKEPTPQAIEELSAQMHTYLYMVEHPCAGAAREVNSLGLLCWRMGRTPLFKSRGANLALIGDLVFVDVPIDRVRFESLVRGVAEAFACESAPDWSERCELCKAARASLCEVARCS